MCVTVSFVFGKNPACDTDRTQTCNLLIRSQMLYSIKLRCRTPCVGLSPERVCKSNQSAPVFQKQHVISFGPGPHF